MFVQFILWGTAAVLFYQGTRIVQRSKQADFPVGKFLGTGLISTGVALCLYAVRDIFVQFKMYDIQYIFYAVGVAFQGIGGFFAVVFTFLGFTPQHIRRIVIPLAGLLILALVSAVAFLPTQTIPKKVPFEPFPYTVLVHPWESIAVSIAFAVGIFLLVAAVFAVFIWNMKYAKGEKAKWKMLLYAFGILFLFLPSILSALVSPVFARLGYLAGSLCIYRAFGLKVAAEDTENT